MYQTTDTKRVPIALLTFVAWAAATLFSMRWASDGTKKPLVDTVTHGISWNIVIAIGVLAVATFAFRWRDLKFVSPDPAGSLKLLWFPLIYLVVFGGTATFLGLPPLSTIFFLLLNTLLVGLSEEWALRGVVFQGLRTRFAMWPAIIGSSILFGSVHIMNVYVTGDFGGAVLQAVTATLSGVVFAALLIRTGSIWVPIVYHALWDFTTFLMSSGASAGADGGPATGLAIFLPILLVLPNFLYALYLLRNVRNDTRLTTD